jgi:RNA polymerase sigma factor (sigma-70 family)
MNGGTTVDRAALADARLQREYQERKRSLMALARRRHGLGREDSEEVADDTLVAWHRELAAGRLRHERMFCEKVLRFEAIDRVRRPTAWTVELAAVEETLGTDPQLDKGVVDREEARLIWRLLHRHERTVLALVLLDMSREEIAEQLGLTVRQVKRILEKARARLREERERAAA